MKKLPKLNTSEKAFVELNHYPFKAMKAYHNRTGVSLQEAKEEVYRFRDNPEAYEAEENNQEQRRRDLDLCLRDIFREAEILEHLNAPIFISTDKSRSDILTLQNNHDIFIEHVEDILAPVFGVDLDEDDYEND